MMQHLDHIKSNVNRDWREGTVNQAGKLQTYFIARNVLIIIVYQIDIQSAFSEQSLIYQRNDQSSRL